MAIHAHSTPMPAPQRGLLRSAGSPCRVLTSAEVVDLVATGSADRCSMPTVFSTVGKNPQVLLPAEPDTAAQAQALHMRRALAQAAEHGAALLAALDLPRLVGPDFVCLDPAVIGDALDMVIDHLDALDTPAEDLEETGDAEPTLGWIDGKPQFFCDYQDCELDTADFEPNLATPEQHPDLSGVSVPWSYVDRGPDSSQLRWAQGAQHDGEVVNEDGDELDVGEHDECDKEPSLGWPNDYRAVLSPVLMADHDPEEVNEDGDDCGEADAPWWDRIGYPVMEGAHV